MWFKKFGWYWTLLLGAIVFLVCANSGRSSDNQSNKELESTLTSNANIFFKKLQDQSVAILDTINLDSDNLKSLPKYWRYFSYDSLQITQWSSNEWEPDSVQLYREGFQFRKHTSGWDCVVKDSNRKIILTHPLVRITQGSFKYKNFIKPLQGVNFELVEKNTGFPILDGEISIGFYGNVGDNDLSGIYFILSQLLFLLAFLVIYSKWSPGIIIVLVGLVAVRYFTYKDLIFTGLGGLEVFNPMVFASSIWLPSLGDLFLNIVLAGVMVFTLRKFIPRIGQFGATTYRILFFIVAVLALFAADLIRSLIVSLVINSNISFDVTDLSSLSWFTALSAFMVFAMLWLFMLLITSVFKVVKFPSVLTMLIIGFAAIFSFYLFQHLDANRSFGGLFPSILLTVFCYLVFFIPDRFSKFYRYIAFLALFSMFFADAVYNSQVKREQEYLDHYAAKLISSKDLEAEYLFKEMENLLAEEFLQPEDFRVFVNKKDVFEKRLRRLYFSGYLDKYNLLVMRFDSVGNNVNSSTRYSFDDLNYLYNFQAFPTLSNHFYQVKSTEVFNGYLAKFENCDIYGHYGNIFILLEPKFIQSSYEYPQLVQHKKEGRIIDLEHYSYAIYSRNQLMHQKGSYSYDLKYDSTRLANNRTDGQTLKYYHVVSHQDEKSLVVLSHPDNRLLAALSTFSFTFVLFTMLLIVFAISWWGLMFLWESYLKKRQNQEAYQAFRYKRLNSLSILGIEQVLLSTRIRVSMVSLVLVGLLISVYVTIQFIRINDKQRSENELMYKIREVANQIQNEVDLSSKLKRLEARQLIVNEVSDVFKLEASLFDSKGYLLASSVEDLYNRGVVAPLMEPRALEKLNMQRSSQILQTERIRNIEFTAAYIPLLDDKRSVIAYLNLPYFTQQHELDREISSYTVTFVNLYLFLMLLAFALAFVVSQRISKPLQIIRNKMSTTGFGGHNELIEWKQNDEIGQLVQQYNKMVVQLVESAEKLSASEREGAWKEMARQVAHEIKNPLTPMKLNIQHLQRAWNDKSTKLEDTFKRVTAVMIEQIDGLSHLAGEFSNFANMPVDNVETCNLTEILTNTIVLFEKTDNVFFQYKSNMPEVCVMADKNQLNRIFSNVIKNAIQAIPSDRKGKISVDLKVNFGFVEVKITDNGKGIPEADRTKIFVPNFSTKTSGMGLGLAMTRKMMEAANGNIRFESTVDKGTSFYLTWPVIAKD